MVRIGERIIGDGHPVFITFEAGPTHNGVESAKRLVKYAADANADAIKFQIIDPDRLVVDPDMMVSYLILKDKISGETERIEEPLRDVLRRRALTNDEWIEIKRYADELDIAFFATIGFEDELDFIIQMGCESVKLASLDVNHVPLLSAMAKTDLCVQLDTGNATIGEIEQAVDLLKEQGSTNFIIHHCPSGYPATISNVNLNIITTLREMFDGPIGFSDHNPGYELDIAAVTLGASLVEKTITEDRTTNSVEHIMSLEPNDSIEFVKKIRTIESALGNTRKHLTKVEKENRNKRRRSAYLVEDGTKGTKLNDLQLQFSRPGLGLQPDQFENFSDCVLIRDLPKGHCISINDLEWSTD